jgi:2-polyprenyl-3-methyl-5-hydroxy-6-metoxy-1,4-benzoquinol methylase
MAWAVRWKDWGKSYLQRVLGITQLREQIESLSESLSDRERVADLQYQDLLILLKRLTNSTPPGAGFRVETEHPVAWFSDDHRFPRGTINDNTRSPRFVAGCERVFGPKLSFLDLGCAGGGLVWDFLIRGHEGVGLEGSDVSLRSQRAEWRHLPDNLFTCDATQPFQVRRGDSSQAATFQVITAWEVLEHISAEQLPMFLQNVRQHLAVPGFFIASVSTLEQFDETSGAVYHVCVKPRAWWTDQLARHGLEVCEQHPFAVDDFCRGTGNGRYDLDFRQSPDAGFHLVARRAVDEN